MRVGATGGEGAPGLGVGERLAVKSFNDHSIIVPFFFYHEMDNHRLKTWLQLQLATDASAVINLPFVLNSLTEEDFLSQGHAQKWTIRISSLIHSKDPGARWAGLSIALKTATLSRDVMNECAHAWITVALPMLFVCLDIVSVLAGSDEHRPQKNETLPCIKACIRLIRFIFSSGVGHAEFQRQVVLPNIVKFSQALVEIVGKYENEMLKVRALFDVLLFFGRLFILSQGSVFRDPLSVGATLPLLAQATPRLLVRVNSQASEWLITRPVSNEARCCRFEVIRRPSVHGWKSWCLELVEEIRRRDFGIYTRRTLLAEG